MPIIQPGFRLINKYTLSIALIVVILIAIIVIKSTGNTSKKEDEKLIRPVRVVKVIHKIAGQSLSLTGEILAKNEIDLSFRIDGKLIERLVSVGDTVTPSQVIARLDSQDVKDNLTAARSNLNAAQAALDIGMKFVSHQFFPSSDRPELLVNMQLPQNSSIFATSNAVAKLEKLLENNSDIVRWSSYVGRGAVRFYLTPTVVKG